MYYKGQVVHNLDTGLPQRVGDPNDTSLWAWTNLPKRSVPYIYIGKRDKPFVEKLATPVSVEEAEIMLAQGIIEPYLTP